MHIAFALLASASLLLTGCGRVDGPTTYEALIEAMPPQRSEDRLPAHYVGSLDGRLEDVLRWANFWKCVWAREELSIAPRAREWLLTAQVPLSVIPVPEKGRQAILLITTPDGGADGRAAAEAVTYGLIDFLTALGERRRETYLTSLAERRVELELDLADTRRQIAALRQQNGVADDEIDAMYQRDSAKHVSLKEELATMREAGREDTPEGQQLAERVKASNEHLRDLYIAIIKLRQQLKMESEELTTISRLEQSRRDAEQRPPSLPLRLIGITRR